MSIIASTLVADLEFLLDDENSERYSFDEDHAPAINAGVRFITSILDQAFDEHLLSPTVLSELLTIVPIATSNKDTVSQIDLSSVKDDIWKLVGVDPTPTLESGSPFQFIDSTGSWAHFVPFDKWGEIGKNPFVPGYNSGATDLARYAYTRIHTDVTSPTAKQLLLLKPAITDTQKIALIYLKNPTTVTATDSTIEFPKSLYQTILSKAYGYIMVQAGKDADFNIQIADKDVQEIVNLLT